MIGKYANDIYFLCIAFLTFFFCEEVSKDAKKSEASNYSIGFGILFRDSERGML